jgi:heat shock protein HtpX
MVHTKFPNANGCRDINRAAVAVTTGIMRILSREKLEEILAHELAHIKNRDILVGIIAATIASAMSYLAQMAQCAMIFGGRSSDEGEHGNPIASL